MEVNQDGNRTTVRLRHLDLNHFIGGEINAVSMLKPFELALQLGIEAQQRLCFESNEGSYLVCLLLWQQTEFCNNFHVSFNSSNKLLDRLNQQLDIIHFPSHIGNASQTYQSVMTNAFGMHVAYAQGKLVNVDPATVKAKPFPQCVQDFCSAKQAKTIENFNQHMPRSCTKKYEKPDNIPFFCRKSQVFATMLGSQHLNSIHYILICFDCLEQALRVGFAKYLDDSIWNNQIRRISSLYMKECFIGDIVKTTVWQNPSNLWIFHFHIDKNDVTVFQAEVEFIPLSVLPKL